MRKTIISFSVCFVVLFALTFSVANAAAPFDGRIIALDAGHGGSQAGAINNNFNPPIKESDVNLDVVLHLKAKLAGLGAKVALTRDRDVTLSTTRERIDIAKAECINNFGRTCDLLVSVHHNGSSNPATDGTLVIYNGNTDYKFATYIHNALIAGLGLPDLGYEKGGYGMTVRGGFVSVLTEAYFISNNSEASQYLAGTRTPQEVNAITAGIGNYLNNQTSGGKKK